MPWTVKRWRVILQNVWETNSWMLHLVTTPAAFSVTTAWSLLAKIHLVNWMFTEVKVVQKESPYSSLLNFFQDPVQSLTHITLDFRERSVLGTNLAYFQSSDLLHSSSDCTQHLDVCTLWSRDSLLTYRWQLADTISVVLHYQWQNLAMILKEDPLQTCLVFLGGFHQIRTAGSRVSFIKHIKLFKRPVSMWQKALSEHAAAEASSLCYSGGTLS